MDRIPTIIRPHRPIASRWGAATLLLLLFAAGALAELVDPPTIQLLKQQYKALDLQNRSQLSKQRELLAQQSKLAEEIESLQESNPGLLGRLKLERLLAQNLDLSNRLSDIAAQLAANDKARGVSREAIYRGYSQEMEQTVELMRKVQNDNKTQATDLAHRFYELQRAREPWKSAAGIDTDFAARIVKVSEDDGPDELEAKAVLLSELGKKVRTAIGEMKKQLKRLQRELKLSSEMNSIVKEMNLFEEGTRFSHRPEDPKQPGDQPQPGQTQPGDDHSVRPDREKPGASGSERAAKSIQADIKKLENEIKVLSQLELELSIKADELRTRARRLRAAID